MSLILILGLSRGIKEEQLHTAIEIQLAQANNSR